ncbi:MAG: ECF transporter S component [Propionibacteriaceae bacterium]|nr:ECF transporter S component [Propionibacteriaceae bacterium]
MSTSTLALPLRLSATKAAALSFGFLVMGLVLPQAVTHIPVIGSMLLPMHIPVLLCGLVCGWRYGALVGAVVPLLSSAMFGMPPLMPIGLAMVPELACYGLVAGLLGARLPQNLLGRLGALVGAMIAGRLVWGLASLIIFTARDTAFTGSAFISGAVLGSWPGIILQLILIPLVMLGVDHYAKQR